MINKIKAFMIVLFFPVVFPIALLWAVSLGRFDIDLNEENDDEM